MFEIILPSKMAMFVVIQLLDGFKHDFLSFGESFSFQSLLYFVLKVVKTLDILLLFLEL